MFHCSNIEAATLLESFVIDVNLSLVSGFQGLAGLNSVMTSGFNLVVVVI